MRKSLISLVLIITSFAVFGGSLVFFKVFKSTDVVVKGATSQNEYLMPSSATFISMGKNKENKDVLSYSSGLSKDQIHKFYSELSGLRLPVNKPCISSVDFSEDSYNNRVVKVTFCK